MNTPWLIGSLGEHASGGTDDKVLTYKGTMFEDVLIFVQFHMYKRPARSDSAIE